MKTILGSKRYHYTARVGIFLIAVSLIAAMAGPALATQHDLAILSTDGSTETGTDSIIPASIDFAPDVLNLRSKGQFLTAYIELPPGYDVGQIDVSSIRLNGTVPALTKPTAIGDYDSDGVPDLMVKFDRAAVEALLMPASQVEMTITGEVAGIAFEGSDTVRVTNPAWCSLNVSSNTGGSVGAPGEGTFSYKTDTVVGLLASSASGYHFVNWTGDVDTITDVNAAATNITMNGDYSIAANFAIEILQIWTWYDLAGIRDNLAGTYVLMNDLDSTTPGYEELTSETANEERGWQPIGTLVDPFTGTFDGQGYEIRDLFINRHDEEDVGLFGVVDEGGRIEDIGVVNIDVTGNSGVGGLLGETDGGTVSNCHATGTVTGNDWVGGLVGAFGEGTVSNCYATGTVTGKNGVGGLVGGIEAGTVSDSYSTGNLIGSSGSWCIGGLVGGLNDTTVVSNCHATGTVTGGTASNLTGGLVGGIGWWSTVSNCYATGTVTGGNSTGGLVGGVGWWSTVSDSYSTGNVTGSSGSWCIGGLVGDIVGGSVSDSYSTGNVIGNSGSWYVGGLVGAIVRGSSVSNSYSSGAVSGTSYVGGLVGYNWESLVTNSFWDTETSGQSESDGGIGKSTAEMQDIDTFSSATWDIIGVIDASTRNHSYIWNIVDGVTYPFLSWE